MLVKTPSLVIQSTNHLAPSLSQEKKLQITANPHPHL